MRQIKNCKKGHFVKFNNVLCQINCFYTSGKEKHATLVEVAEKGEQKRLFTPKASEKVEYIGEYAIDDRGIWIIDNNIPYLDEMPF